MKDKLYNVRIQKYLSKIGIFSRRQTENLIKIGAIKLNGKICELGDIVNIGDIILIKNDKKTERIIVKAKDFKTTSRILLYNKPLSEICTRADNKNRKTVFDNLPKLKTGKWISVGRLDINTTGLLLFVTDGNLANKLMHPSSNIEREYLVKIKGNLTNEKKQNLLKGIKLDCGLCKFKSIEELHEKNKFTKNSPFEKNKKNHKPNKTNNNEQTCRHNNNWYKVILCEGKNREIRKLFLSQNILVNKLIRIRFGKIKLPKNLEKGKFIEIQQKNF